MNVKDLRNTVCTTPIIYFASSHTSLSVPLNFRTTVIYDLFYCFFHISHILCSLHRPLRLSFCLPRPYISYFLSLYFFDDTIYIFKPPINLLSLSLLHSPPHLPHTCPSKNVLRCLFTFRNREVPCLILATEVNNSVAFLS